MNAGRMMLSAPVRLYWELVPEPAGGMAAERAAGIAGELVSMKVFFATLKLGGGPRPDLAGIVSRLKSGGVGVKLTVSDVESLPGHDVIELFDGIGLYLDMPEGGLDAGLDILYDACCDAASGSPPSVSVVPSNLNAADFGAFFEKCIKLGIASISLTNPNLVDRAGGPGLYSLDPDARAAIKRASESVLKGHGGTVKLFVHDLFLYRELDLPGLGERLEYAGCQAAEAVAYIGSDGILYPCSTWPEPLGDLNKSSLYDVWNSDKRREVVMRIGKLPEPCEACALKDGCFGGCRGMAFALMGEDGPDPACPIINDRQ